MSIRLLMSPRKYLWFVLLALTLWRLLIATQVGLGVDEAHYVLYGRYLDLSYFDHPPLVGWIHYVFQQLSFFGKSTGEFLARLPAIVISLITSVLAFRFLLRRGFSEAASSFAVVLLNVTPLFNGLSLLLLPDTMLMPLVFLVIESAENAAQKNTGKQSFQAWLCLGFWLGLSGLSKYTAILFVPGLAIYFLRQARWRQILRPGFLAGVAVALVVVSPIFVWNFRNHFISFSYQSDHVLAFQNFSFENFFKTWVSQFVIWGMGPAILAIGPIFSAQAWRKNELLNLFSLSFVVFFGGISFFQALLPHWTLCLFVLMIPLGAARFWEENTISVGNWKTKLIVASTLVLTLPLMLELGFRVLPPSWTVMLYRDVSQWEQVMSEAARISDQELKGELRGVAVFNWTLGSRAIYYAPLGTKVFVLDGKNHQFAVWNPVSPKGFDLIVAVEDEKIEETLSQITCEEVQKVGHRKSMQGGALLHQFSYYRCLNYRGLVNEN